MSFDRFYQTKRQQKTITLLCLCVWLRDGLLTITIPLYIIHFSYQRHNADINCVSMQPEPPNIFYLTNTALLLYGRGFLNSDFILRILTTHNTGAFPFIICSVHSASSELTDVCSNHRPLIL